MRLLSGLAFLAIFSLFLFFNSCTGDDDDNDTQNEDPPLTTIPYALTPDWVSTDVSNVSTGLGIADINGDSWPDIIVANGNDIRRQNVVVYYNQGNGNFPSEPDWLSSDIDYHGHLAIGDINGDGFDDVFVSVYIGANGFDSPGHVKLYKNLQGQLEPYPSWRSLESFYTFSLALGDCDNDGDLDLAVATGESYTDRPDNNRIFFNDNGQFDIMPSWISQLKDYSMDAAFADIDGNGFLDLVFAASKGPTTIYFNTDGVLEDFPSWVSQDEAEDSNSLYISDLNMDGFQDIAVSDNYQLGDSGHFKVYMNNAGTPEYIPAWISQEQSYGSAIAAIDLNRDSFPELIAGNWGENQNIGNGKTRIYTNDNGTLPQTSDWVSQTESVIEAYCFADLNMDGLLTSIENTTLQAGDSLVTVNHLPIERIASLSLNGQTLGPDSYCFNREYGWISINRTLITETNTITVQYTSSKSPEMIVTNWDRNVGNFIYFNTNTD